MDLPGDYRRARYLRNSSCDPYKPNFILTSTIRHTVFLCVRNNPSLRQWKDCIFDIGVELSSLLLRSPTLRATHFLNHDMMFSTASRDGGPVNAGAHPERIILHGNSSICEPYTPPQVYVVRLRLKLPLVTYENESAQCVFASNISYVILNQTMVLPQVIQYISQCFTDAIHALDVDETQDGSSHLWNDHSTSFNTFVSDDGLGLISDTLDFLTVSKDELRLSSSSQNKESTSVSVNPLIAETISSHADRTSPGIIPPSSSSPARDRNTHTALSHPSSQSPSLPNTDDILPLANQINSTSSFLGNNSSPSAYTRPGFDYNESPHYPERSPLPMSPSPSNTPPLDMKSPNIDNTFSSNGDSRDRQTDELSAAGDLLCGDEFEHNLLLGSSGDHCRSQPIPELLGSPLRVDSCPGYFDSLNMSLPFSLQYPLGALSPSRRSFLARRQQDDTEDLEYAFRNKSDQVPQFIRRDKKFKYIKVGKVQKFVNLFEEQRGLA